MFDITRRNMNQFLQKSRTQEQIHSQCAFTGKCKLETDGNKRKLSVIHFTLLDSISNTEGKRNFETHSHLSVEIKNKNTHQRSRMTIENMIGDVIDTFRITKMAVNQTLVRKSRNDTSTSHSTLHSSI